MSVPMDVFYPIFKAVVREGFEEMDRRIASKPIICLPLMRIPAREVEKATKYLPEMWKPNG